MKRGVLWNGLLALGSFFFVLFVGLPFWWVFTGSIKISQEIIQRLPTMIPHSFTTAHFEKLLGGSNYLSYLLNSLVVSVFSTALTLALATPAAYAFFRMRFRGREKLFRAILLAYAFPSIVVLIPVFQMYARLGLTDTLTGLVLINTAFALPFAIWLMRSFFSAVPLEIEEAAIMDGASGLVVLRRIMIPLVAPGIASVGVFAFITAWTEYTFASVLILSDAKRTMPVGFSGIIGQYQIDWGLLLAGCVIAILPVVVIFALIGRWFVGGLMSGAVK